MLAYAHGNLFTEVMGIVNKFGFGFFFFLFNQCSTGKYYFLTRDSKQQTLFSIFLKYHTTTQKEEGNIYNLYGFCKRASTQPLLYIAKLRNCVQCEPFTVCGYKEPIIWPLVSP